MFVTKMSDGLEIRIRFTHFDDHVELDDDELFLTKTTEATIEAKEDSAEDWEEVSVGLSTCSPKREGCPGDQFSKARGRKLALARAMKKSYFSPSGRKKLWGVYLAKIGKWTKEFNSEEDK